MLRKLVGRLTGGGRRGTGPATGGGGGRRGTGNQDIERGVRSLLRGFRKRH